MRVGLTYDLRVDYLAAGYSEDDTAEFDAQVTVDGLTAALEARGHTVDPIGHVWALTRRLAAGDRWDLVFNVCEGLRGIARESQVPALLEAWGIPYVFSDPITLGISLDKALCKRVVRDGGIPTADFVVVEDVGSIDSIPFGFPMFCKPVGEGSSKGITARSRVTNRDELRNTVTETLDLWKQPVLVEAFLPGREFTVGIVGTGAGARTIGVMEVLPYAGLDEFVYSYDVKDHWEHQVDYVIADDAVAVEAAKVALRAWRHLRCRDGGRVDIRCDATGQPCFIEVNPLAGLNPERSDIVFLGRMAGWPYQRIIDAILDSAVARMGEVRGPGPLALRPQGVTGDMPHGTPGERRVGDVRDERSADDRSALDVHLETEREEWEASRAELETENASLRGAKVALESELEELRGEHERRIRKLTGVVEMLEERVSTVQAAATEERLAASRSAGVPFVMGVVVGGVLGWSVHGG